MKKKETYEIDSVPYAKLFCASLSEKDRRLFCALEALRLGYYGVAEVSETYGINKHTVRKGKKELLSKDFAGDRIRKQGGGRKKKPIAL